MTSIFQKPPWIIEINYSSLEDEEDDEYNPKPPVYPEINYSSDDNQDQARPLQCNQLALDDVVSSDAEYNPELPLGFSSELYQESNEYLSDPFSFSDL
ncbi:hypothetical protein R1flu_024795 [Riccia fluitans]|uniref:Acetyl-CoA carboxylase carboxyltransferase beta subunit n=1 Tax=Riccia fluitans TaxID=41844 RepID=A0ABD1XVX5_9MARC